MATGAMAIAGLSVALAEVFSAVGLSTLIPATYVEIARAARRLLDGSPNSLTGPEMTAAIASVAKLLPSATGTDGATGNADVAAKILQSLLASSDTIDLLLPKTAHIDAAFNFQAALGAEAGAGVGATLDVVTVKAGFSALYSESSSCKVNMSIDYVSVQEQLAGARFSGSPVSGQPAPVSFKVGDADIVRNFGAFTDASLNPSGVVKTVPDTLDDATRASGKITLHAVAVGKSTLTVTFDNGSTMTLPISVTG